MGNVSALGNWDVDKALFMLTDKDIYPFWNIEFMVSAAEAEKIEYKFLKIANTEEMEVEWEPIHVNRLINTKQRAGVVMEEVYGSVDKRAETFVRRP